jgi:hypothetical protein
MNKTQKGLQNKNLHKLDLGSPIEKYGKNRVIEEKNTSLEGFRTIILIFMMFSMVIFMSNLVFAYDFDNVAKEVQITKGESITLDKTVIKYNKLWEKYPPVEIKNLYGLGDTLADVVLTKHDETCGQDCLSEFSIYLGQESPLIDDIKFYRVDEGKFEERSIRGYGISYWGLITDYEENCTLLNVPIRNENGNYVYKKCDKLEVGSHEGWINYNLGSKLPSGVYEVKLNGEKAPYMAIDWIIKSQGKTLDSLATWGNISTGSQAEVILINPSDSSSQLDSVLSTTASGNVTGGAKLRNVSLYSNSSGTWTIRNTSVISTPANITADTTWDPHSVTNPTYAFDGSVSTYANHDDVGSSAESVNLGKNLTTKYIYNVSVDAEGYSDSHPGGSVGADCYATVNLDIHNATGWYTIKQWNAQQNTVHQCSATSTVNETVVVNSNADYVGVSISVTASSGTYNARKRWYEISAVSDKNYSLNSFSNKYSSGTVLWNMLYCDSDGACGFAPANRTFSTVPMVENSRTYTANTYETATETFIINITSDLGHSISNALFWYNGTAYSVNNLTTTANYYLLTNSITVPTNLNQTANSTYNFFWSITANGIQTNTSTTSQVSQPILLILCDGTYTTKALNFSARNETIPLGYLSSWVFGGFFKYGTTSGNLNKNFSLQNNTVGSEVDLCISPASVTIYVDADIDYTASGFLPRSYYLRNAPVTSSLQNISLWGTTSTESSNIIVSVKNQYLEPQKNYVIQLMRYYPGYGLYYNVETAKTDDFGQASIKIVENDIDYKMLILDETGVLVHTTSPMRIICTATPCVVEVIIGTSESTLANVLVTQGITSGFTYNNATHYITFTYSDPTGLTSNMRLQVVQTKSYANIEICNSNSTGSAGVITCYIRDLTGNYIARAYRSASPETAFNTFTLSLSQAWQTFGATGLFWAMVITVVMFFTGLVVSPILAALLSMASIVLFMFLGIVAMPMGLFIALMILFIIFIVKIRA